MEATEAGYGDPQNLRWSGLSWSEWCPLLKTGDRDGLVPKEQGIYRVRCRSHGHPELIYIGISERGLRSRIGSLRRGVRVVPDPVERLGHIAAPCVASHLQAGNAVEISWAALPKMDKRELMGREVDLIAACRRRFRESPACQFHGSPRE
jgi:hypothetical protein